jgi:hypothetical protein
MFRNLDKIKNNLGADLYNHIGSLNKTQLQKQLKELRSELGRISNKKDSRYYNLKDEEFFILYRLEKADEFQYAKGGKMGKTNKEKVEEPKDSYVVEVRYYYDNNDNEDGYDEPDYSTEYHTFSSKEEAFAFARKNERNVEEIFYYPKGTDFNPQRLFAKGGILSGFNYSIGGL